MSGITATDLCECCRQALPKPVYEVGRVRLEVAGMRAFVDDQPLHLGPQLFQLLELLIRRPGMAFCRDTIAVALGTEAEDERKLVNTRISQLRRALGSAAEIKTVWGEGAYRLVPPAREMRC